MRKITFIILLTIFYIAPTTVAFAQNKGIKKDNYVKPLFQVFTSSTCGPCNGANDVLDSILANNPNDSYSLIKYQLNVPGDGDPYYIEDAGIRRTYYGVGGIPSMQIFEFDDIHPAYFTQSAFDETLTASTKMTISIDSARIKLDKTIDVVATIQVEENFDAGLKVHIAVVEKTTVENVGTNGETKFHNVMMKMLPDAYGTSLPALDPSTPFIVTQSQNLDTCFIEEPTDLQVIVFVQDDSDKNIIQSEWRDVDFEMPTTIDDCELISIGNVPVEVCGDGSVSPEITVRNIAGNAISSMNIAYKINNGPEMNYKWTGNLDYYEKTNIELPAISYTLEDINPLKITVDSVNGNADTDLTNSTQSDTILRAPVYGILSLTLKTDDYGSEITWAIIDDNGDIVHSGGPYEDDNSTIVVDSTFDLENGCYTFEIYDDFGDGIEEGYGYYKLFSNGVLVVEGGIFGYEDIVPFGIDIIGVETMASDQGLRIYPNPAIDLVHIKSNNSIHSVSIYNSVGQIIFTEEVLNKTYSVNTTNFDKGIYFFEVMTNKNLTTTKILIR